MSVSPYTQKRLAKDRGPQTSEDYNARVEENYRDLMYLYNAMGLAQNEIDSFFATVYKQLMAMSSQVSQFDVRLDALEASSSSMVFYTNEQIDTTRFNSTAYAVPTTDQLTYHKTHNVLTLPHVVDSSVSKLRFLNADGTFSVANGFEVLVSQISASADSGAAVIETSSPYDAMQGRLGRVWERNVIASATHANGAQCYVYVRIPNELSITGNSNVLSLVPYPVFDVDVLELAYSTDPHVAFTETAAWQVFNEDDWYLNNQSAVGHLPPGAWTGDAILNSGPKLFYFEPQPITAIRIRLRQNNYYNRGAQFLYSYGLSELDIRYDKFLPNRKSYHSFRCPG